MEDDDTKQKIFVFLFFLTPVQMKLFCIYQKLNTFILSLQKNRCLETKYNILGAKINKYIDYIIKNWKSDF